MSKTQIAFFVVLGVTSWIIFNVPNQGSTKLHEESRNIMPYRTSFICVSFKALDRLGGQKRLRIDVVHRRFLLQGSRQHD